MFHSLAPILLGSLLALCSTCASAGDVCGYPPGAPAVDLYDCMGHRYSVESALLRAISTAESHGYPWTVDLNGNPFFFSSRDKAIEFVNLAKVRTWLVVVSYSDRPDERYLYDSEASANALRASLKGISNFTVKHVDSSNVDIGLMQVNWSYHSTEVPSLERLMDTDYNVAFAAKLLSDLIKKHKNVWTAVGYYHSSDPDEQKRYETIVKAIYEKMLHQ